jgi:hypothetical protein
MNICLVGCGKSKLDEPSQAQDLYTGSLFRKASAYANLKQFDSWGILSAKHGLLMPWDVIAPYNVAMSDLSPMKRAAWCRDTNRQIVGRWGDESTFTVLAGKPYLCALEGLTTWLPLEGMGIGERLHWLTVAIKREGQ